MASSPTSLPAPTGALFAFGRWVYPRSRFRTGSIEEAALQRRAAIVSLGMLTTGLGALTFALVSVIQREPVALPGREALDSSALLAAVILGLVSVFAPQAVFRTRSDASIRRMLADPSAPFRPWQTSTITFDAMLVGGMLAGLYFPASLTFSVLGSALVVKFLITGPHTLRRDPNARYHRLMKAWSSAAVAMIAYAIVVSIAPVLDPAQVFIPLVVAGLAAHILNLAISALDAWVEGDPNGRFHFFAEVVNPRRIAVAAVSAIIALFVVVVGDLVEQTTMASDDFFGAGAGLAGFLLAWLLLWLASIRLWSLDADRALTLWGDHEAEVIQRIAAGQLDPVLAARAAPITTARMAIMTFAATRAWVLVEDSHSAPQTHLAVADLYANTPEPEPRSLIEGPHLTLPLYERPDEVNASRVVIADWLWPGSFLTRSHRIVRRFRQLAIESIISPKAARDDVVKANAFDSMFEAKHHWPTTTAFTQALDRMRSRADANPTSDSVVIGVYSIDDFGALAGGKFEQAAVGQVMRMAAGFPAFAGHDVFLSYEDPGRLWIALAGGPMIRSGIETLRSLQQKINDGGAVPASHVDLDVHVGVSFGYAAHQVDDFATEGLMKVAIERLAVDMAARNPLHEVALRLQDITPEAIIGSSDLPALPIDVLAVLDEDRATRPESFIRHYRPIIDIRTQETEGLFVCVGWDKEIGQADLRDPQVFQAFTTRQIELASSSVLVSSEAVRNSLDQLTALERFEIPIVVPVPPVLLTPEAGAAALPNVLVPQLDRKDLSRLIIHINTIPFGSGEALRTLADRGVRISVTAAAAANATNDDLSGWPRWAIVFPASVIDRGGLDTLFIHQTVSAIAGPDTHLIAEATPQVLESTKSGITWALEPSTGYSSIGAALEVSTGAAHEMPRQTSDVVMGSLRLPTAPPN